MAAAVEIINSVLQDPLVHDTLYGLDQTGQQSLSDATIQHSVEVAVMVGEAAGYIDIPEDILRGAVYGAVLHDVGRGSRYLPANVARKPGVLETSDWQHMRLHPVYSLMAFMAVKHTIVPPLSSCGDLAARSVIAGHHSIQRDNPLTTEDIWQNPGFNTEVLVDAMRIIKAAKGNQLLEIIAISDELNAFMYPERRKHYMIDRLRDEGYDAHLLFDFGPRRLRVIKQIIRDQLGSDDGVYGQRLSINGEDILEWLVTSERTMDVANHPSVRKFFSRQAAQQPYAQAL